MDDMTTKKDKKEIQKRVANIWKRARINAFAHKVALERYAAAARKYNNISFISGLLAMLFTMGLLILSSKDVSELFNQHSYVLIALKVFITILSIISAGFSLHYGQYSNAEHFETQASEHKWLLGAYQFIAQRARSVRWPDMEIEEMIYILRTLEEQFQMLKARGSEPSDEDFEEAHQIMKRIRDRPEIASTQSFSDFDRRSDESI